MLIFSLFCTFFIHCNMYTCTGICGCVDINGCTTFVRKYLNKHNLGQIREPEDLVSINRMVIKTKYWFLEAKERHFVLPSFMFSSSSNERLSLIVRRVKMVFVNGTQIFESLHHRLSLLKRNVGFHSPSHWRAMVKQLGL